MAKKKHVEEEEDVLLDARIDPLDVNASFLTLPGQVAYYNERYAEAYRRFLAAKRNVDQVYATVYLEERDTAESTRAKTTEATLKATVEIDDRYISACDQLVLAESAKVRIQGALETLRTKRDCLISLGANMRAELGGSPSIRKSVADDD